MNSTNQQIIISIIIPVFNVELWIRKCITSILKQTFINFELILVDDGSTDKSGDICDEFSQKDKRIRVFHRKNCGVSSSRNYGLKQAVGQYVTFIDADDEIYPNTIKENINILLNNKNIDILQFPYYRVEKNGKIIKYASDVPIIYTSTIEIFQDIVNDGPITWASWGKIYKKDLYSKLLFYENMTINEDLYALIKIIDDIHCFYISTLGGYVYYYREGSACNSNYNCSKSLDYCRTTILIYQKAVDYNLNISQYWKAAVKYCIDSWAYYGPNEELKRFLKILYIKKGKIETEKKDVKSIRISQLLSPLIAAYLKRIVLKILRLNKQ